MSDRGFASRVHGVADALQARVYTALRSPDDLLIVAAGGPAGGFGAIIAPWNGSKGVEVTMPVRPAGR